MPSILKNTNAAPKVDLRIMSTLNSKGGDYSLGEFAKMAEGTKYYHDKLKLALMAKFHLNSLLESNTNVKYPFIMIMGLAFVVFSIEFVNDVGYVVKQIDQCCFPITRKAINEGGIQRLMLCISNVKVRYDLT